MFWNDDDDKGGDNNDDDGDNFADTISKMDLMKIIATPPISLLMLMLVKMMRTMKVVTTMTNFDV